MSVNDVRSGERIPVTLRIRLKYSDEANFIERYSMNVSRGGIFVATRTPKPVGTLLAFEFQLDGGETLIRGEGNVVWVTPFDPAQPDKPHGMGVRFNRLDEASLRVIERALVWKEKMRLRREAAERVAAGQADEPGADSDDQAPADEPTRRVDLGLRTPRLDDDPPRPPTYPPGHSFIPSPHSVVRDSSPVIVLEADEPDEAEAAPQYRTPPPPPPPPPSPVRAVASPVPAINGAPAAAPESERGHRPPPPPPPPTRRAAAVVPPRNGAPHAQAVDEVLETLAAEAGVDEQRIEGVIARARDLAQPLLARFAADDRALDSLLDPAPPAPAISGADARALLDGLLSAGK